MTQPKETTPEERAPQLFALGAARTFGEAVSRHLSVPLSAHEERDFEDGEHKVRPLVSVRDRRLFVLQALYSSGDESVNDRLCRLLFFIGALKDAGAGPVTAVVPYLAYARKERKTKPRDPVTTRYVAQLFEAVDVDRLVTMDVHNLAAYQNAFRCRTEHLEARGLFAEHFAARLSGAEPIVVSPDVGGVKRAEQFRQALARRLGLEVPMGFVEKQRSEGALSGEALVGRMEGRTVILLDDLISTGGTLVRAARKCLSAGAERVWAAATHGLFTGGGGGALEASELERIVVTNTVERAPTGAVREKLEVVDAAPLVAEAIRRLASGASLMELRSEEAGRAVFSGRGDSSGQASGT